MLIAAVLLVFAIGAWARVGTAWRRDRPLRRHLAAAEQYTRQGMGPELEAELKEVVRLDPSYAPAYELLAEYYLSAQQWTKAKTALERLASLAPETEHLQCRMAACSLNIGDEVSAFRQSEAEVKRDGECVAALATSAILLNGMGEKPRALVYLRRLGRLQPEDPVLQFMLAEALNDTFAYREARPVLERVLRLQPENGEAYALMGAGWTDDPSAPDHLKRAEQALRKSLALNPLNADARLAFGRLLLRQNRPREAVVQLEEAARLMPHSTRPPFELERAFHLARQPERAAAARRRFLALRNLSSRVSALEKRCSVNPTVFEYPYQLGLIELRRGDYRRATVWLHKAKALRPGDRRVAAALDQLSRLSAAPARLAAVEERISQGSGATPAGGGRAAPAAR